MTDWQRVLPVQADGLAESVVFGCSSDGAGRVLVKFGAVPNIAVLDGYRGGPDTPT